MKAVGIDLTNAITQCSSCPGNDWFPSAVLPMVKDEPVLVGGAAKLHRRGAGLSWPPECQIPYSNDSMYGKGRVALAEAWRYLASFDTQDLAWDNYQPFQRQIAWQPNPSDNRSRVSFSAEDLISEAAGICIKDYSEHGQICFVVPDDMGEGAQQALLDRLGASSSIHLLPRPIAIAADWCSRQDPDEFRVLDRNNGYCGYLWVLSAAMDRWEFCPVEIRKVSSDQSDCLIPVRDHTEHSSGLAVDGLSLLAAHAIAVGKADLSDVWFKIMTGNLVKDLEDEACDIDQFRKACSSVKAWHGRLDPTMHDCLLNLDYLNSSIIEHANKFNKRDRECLGTIADGSLARLYVGGVSLAQRVLDEYDDYEIFEVTNGSATVNGAEVVAQQLQKDLPTYRDRIAPVFIYYTDRDEYWDPKISTKLLIEGKTVEAGKVAKTKSPLTGFYIAAGNDSLTLILGREFGEVYTKGIEAQLREAVTQNESVTISAEIRPGQGYASAQIRSLKPGVFESKLNWRTMRECDPPSEPSYAWPTGMVRFGASGQRIDWQLENALKELSSPPKQKHSWDSISFRSSNSLADTLAKWKYEGGNQYISPLASDNTFSTFYKPDRLKELSQLLGLAVKKYPYNATLFRLSGWMYQASPSATIDIVLSRLLDGELESADPEVIGKAFSEPEHMKIFAKFLSSEIAKGNRNYHWIRSFRDLIRLRVDALSLEVISKEEMGIIEKGILDILEDYKTRQRSSYYNASLYLAPHLLKRRRFDPEFLSVGSYRYKKWIEHLLYALENRPDRQKEFAKVMIPFLNAQGNKSDLLDFQRADASV